MANELIEHSTVTNMVNAWELEMPKINAALEQIGQSLEALNTAFQISNYRDFNLRFEIDHSRQCFAPGDRQAIQRLRNDFHRRAWAAICKKIEIRKLLSSKRAKELDEQLDGKGEALPALTVEMILGVVNGFASGVPEYLDEACAEVYEFLVGRRHDGYKTNKLGEIGPKRIIGYGVSPGYGNSKFKTNYHRDQQLNSLSNVFALLDGKGPSSEYKGELVASINSSKAGLGETTYFKWKGFKNGNLHIEFKRLDLVEELVKRCAKRNQLNNRSKPSDSPSFELTCN